MASITLYPSAVDTTNSTYAGVSPTYPLSALVGQGTNNTGYGAGILLTTGNNATTNVYINFDVSSIPENATITSVTCKAAIYGSSTTASRTSSRTVQLCKNTTKVGSAVTWSVSGSTDTPSITNSGSWTREDLNNIKLLISATRNTSNATSNTYIYIRGVDLTIEYEEVINHNITIQHSDDIVIDKPNSNSITHGNNFIVTITGDVVSITDNGTNVLNQLVDVSMSGGNETLTNNLGTYTLISGSMNGNGTSYFSGRAGMGSDASASTSNYYSSSSSTKAVFQYDVSFSDIPENATITNVYLKAKGKCESTSNTNEYMCVQLKSGNTALTEQYNWKNSGSTNTSIQTLQCTTTPTVEQLQNLVVECTLGYYGGNIAGATVYVEYEVPASGGNSKTYTITNVSEDHIIIISSSTGTNLYIKTNSDIVKNVQRVLIKTVSGWESLENLSEYFIAGKHFQKGN